MIDMAMHWHELDQWILFWLQISFNVCLTFCRFVCLSVSLSLSLSFSVCLCVCFSLYLCLSLSLCLSVCLSVYLKTIVESEKWNEAADVKATAEDVVAQFKERYRIPRLVVASQLNNTIHPCSQDFNSLSVHTATPPTKLIPVFVLRRWLVHFVATSTTKHTILRLNNMYGHYNITTSTLNSKKDCHLLATSWINHSSFLFLFFIFHCSVSRSSSSNPADTDNLLDDTSITSPSNDPDPVVESHHQHASASVLNKEPQRTPSLSSCDSFGSNGSRRNRGKKIVRICTFIRQNTSTPEVYQVHICIFGKSCIQKRKDCWFIFYSYHSRV